MLRDWRPWAFASGIVIAVLAAWQCVRILDSRRLESTLKAAKQAIAARSSRVARKILADASVRWPGNAEVQFLLGAAEHSLGRLAAANTAWSRVPPGSPFAPHAALYRARLVLEHDRFADAEGLLVDALRGSPAHATEACETLVNLYKLQGRFSEARMLVLGALEFYPNPTAVIRELENLGSNRPVTVEVVRSTLERASRHAPDDDRIWLGWANLATRTGKFGEAKRWLDVCLQRRPNDGAVWRGWLDWAIATQDEAEVERAVRHLPENLLSPLEVLSLRGWFAARAGDSAWERRVQEEMVALETGNLRALERLADLVLADGQTERAAQLRERRSELNRIKLQYETMVLKLDPRDAPQAARLAESLGRVIEAQILWSIVLRNAPGNGEANEAMDRLKKAEFRRSNAPTLGILIAELDAPARRGAPKRSARSERNPDFVDDSVRAGLVFTFDNGVSTFRHMPETTSGGVGLLDYDGDGWLDVYLTQAGPFPPDPTSFHTEGDRLFHNRGNGTFEDATDCSGLAAFARGYSHGVAVGDIDNDGHPDIFVTRWHGYALYRNKGDGTFEDVTARYGLGGDRDWPTSAAFADLDGDGDLDLYVCHYLFWDLEKPNFCRDTKGAYIYCAPQYSPSLPDHLFRNDGGRFTDVTAQAGIVDRDGRGLGVVAADLDGDGRLDLFVANDQSANFLFRNKGGLCFEEIGGPAGVASSSSGLYQASMGIACGDLDGDGLLDVAKTNFYNESMTFYRNRGAGVFTDSTSEVGLVVPTRYLLGFGAAFLDVNNDGWLDLATANGHVGDFRPEIPWQMPAQLLVGTGNGTLVDVSDKAGPPWRVPRLGRGLAAGDLDNDARVDLLIVSQNSPLAYFHNRTVAGHSLTLQLEGTVSNRDAIGARVTVTAGGRRLSAWRIGGGSYQSASDPRVHLGLGDLSRAEQIEVSWPSGRVDRFGPLEADTGYRLREGAAAPESLRGFTPAQAAVGDRDPERTRRSGQARQPAPSPARVNAEFQMHPAEVPVSRNQGRPEPDPLTRVSFLRPSSGAP
jgi:enediyne biosynthesis protein E4